MILIIIIISILSKVASHPFLLQYDPNDENTVKEKGIKQFITEALPAELVAEIGNAKYISIS